MPPAGVIIAAAVSAGGALALGTSSILGLGAIGGALAIFGAQVALGTLSSLLAPKVALPNLAPLEVQATGVTQTVRQAITARRQLYGEARISGPIVFLESSSDNQFLYLVIALCEGPVSAITTIYLNDEAIFVDDMDSAGAVTAGKYAGKATIRKHLGASDQAADSWLISERPNAWTTNHRLRGTAYLVVRLTADRNLFPTGIPNISAWVRGPALFDPRDSATRWTTNAALVLRAYLADTRLGLGALAAEIDDSFVNAAANVCDEFVTVKSGAGTTQEVTSVDAANDYLVLDGERLGTQTGDRVQLTTDGVPPGGLATATDYYVIPRQEVAPVQIQLAASYADALAGTAITLSDGGSGKHVVNKTAEPRYTANGVVTSDRRPSDVIGDMLSAMGGRAINAGGTWRMLAAAWAPAAVTLDESVLRGPIEVQTRHSRRERFNAIKGIYVSPQQGGQPTDYPAVTSAGFEAVDGGRRIYWDLDLPMTGRAQAAQRLAKIELLRHRQEITVQLRCTLAALQVQAGDTVALSNSRYGWADKPFEIVRWTLAIDAGTGDDAAPFFGVDLQLRETASAVFDFDAALDETLVDPAPNTNLPNPFTVLAPGAPQVTEVAYSTREGGGLKAKAVVSWQASADAFVEAYQFEYKLAAVSIWTVLAPSPATAHEILDTTPGLYDFRVKALNALGVSSAYSTVLNVELFGLAAPPAALTGLTLSSIGGLAVLRWDRSVDLDVREGGKIVFRHAAALSGATWQGSVSIGDAVAGAESVALLPLKAGTYLAKAVDGSGVGSAAAAMVSTDQATALTYSDVAAVSEHPTFPGSHAGTAAPDGVLKLAGGLALDSWADIDSVADWDSNGGVALSGIYGFGAGIDLATKRRARLTTRLVATAINVLDKIDSRTALIDAWEDFDGNEAAAADCQVWTRGTDDDPTGSPIWGTWQRLDSAEQYARAFQFEARLSTADPAYNIHIDELRVDAAEVV